MCIKADSLPLFYKPTHETSHRLRFFNEFSTSSITNPTPGAGYVESVCHKTPVASMCVLHKHFKNIPFPVTWLVCWFKIRSRTPVFGVRRFMIWPQNVLVWVLRNSRLCQTTPLNYMHWAISAVPSWQQRSVRQSSFRLHATCWQTLKFYLHRKTWKMQQNVTRSRLWLLLSDSQTKRALTVGRETTTLEELIEQMTEIKTDNNQKTKS